MKKKKWLTRLNPEEFSGKVYEEQKVNPYEPIEFTPEENYINPYNQLEIECKTSSFDPYAAQNFVMDPPKPGIKRNRKSMLHRHVHHQPSSGDLTNILPTKDNPYGDAAMNVNDTQATNSLPKLMQFWVDAARKICHETLGQGAAETEWNTEFQKALTEERPSEKDKALSKISANFSLIATLYGEIIIIETCLNDIDDRAIKSKSDFGGMAGGVKTLTRNVLFKFCNDPPLTPKVYMYGGKDYDYELSAKSAGHELKGAINALSACVIVNNKSQDQQNRVTTAIMCVIDHVGLRLVAMPLLPLKKLLYGSDDSMLTVKNNADIDKIMEKIADEVHLKKHHIGNNKEGPLHTAGDVEGHIGEDGNYYIIDTARFFPPESPSVCRHLQKRGNVTLYRMLRPELLQILKKVKDFPRLNADVWTGWADSSDQIAQEESSRATSFMLVEAMKSMATELYEKKLILFSISELHRHGINVRHMGLLRSKKDHEVFVTIIARVKKNHLRQSLRVGANAGKSNTELEQHIVLLWLNTFTNTSPLVTSSPRSPRSTVIENEFWGRLLGGIILRFGTCLSNTEIDEFTGGQVLSKLHRFNKLKSLITSALASTGIDLSSDCKNAQFYQFTFTQADIKLGTKVKQFDTIDYALANMFCKEAKELEFRHRTAAHRLYNLSAKHYRAVIAVAPLNVGVIYQEAMSQIRAFELVSKHVDSAKRVNHILNYYPLHSKLRDEFIDILKKRKKWICNLQEIEQMVNILCQSKTVVFQADSALGLELSQKKVIKVSPNTQASINGVEVGMMISQVNSEDQPNDHDEIIKAILKTKRKGQPTTILFTMNPVKTFAKISELNPIVQFELPNKEKFDPLPLEPNDLTFLITNKEIKEQNMWLIHDEDLSSQGLKLLPKILKGITIVQNVQLQDDPPININVFRGDTANLVNKGYTDKSCTLISHFLEINGFLKHLNLSQNKIGDDGVTSLARALKSSVSIKSLSLRNNNISDRGVTHLSGSFDTNSSLKSLELCNNKISYGAARLLVFSIIFSQKTKVLVKSKDGKEKEAVISGRCIEGSFPVTYDKDPNRGMIQISSLYLNQEKTLNFLSLVKNKISRDEEKQITDCLKKCLSRQKNKSSLLINWRIPLGQFRGDTVVADLSSQGYRNNDAEVISFLLKKNKSLVQIKLPGNEFTQKGAEYLADGLIENTVIKNIQINGSIPISQIRSQVRSNQSDQEISGPSNYVSVNLFGKDYKYHDIIIISHFLKKNSTLTKLNLGNNEIGTIGLAALGKSLGGGGNKTLKWLILSRNNITDSDLKSIINELRFNKALTELNLSQNKISDAGVKMINHLLKENKSITSLNLNKNKITNLGANDLGHALKFNSILKTLILSDNEIGDKGIKEIAKSFQQPVVKSEEIREKKKGEEKKSSQRMDLKDLTDHFMDNGKCSIAKIKNLIIQGHSTPGTFLAKSSTRGVYFKIEVHKPVNITELDLSNNHITNASEASLCNIINKTEGLLLLSLEGNQINKSDQSCVSQAWKEKTIENKLPINWNVPLKPFYNAEKAIEHKNKEYKNSDVSIIASFLKKSYKLERLILSHNCIGDEGTCIIGEILKINSTLRILHLDANKIGNKGAEAIKDALLHNFTLNVLDMRENKNITIAPQLLALALTQKSTINMFNCISLSSLKGNSNGKIELILQDDHIGDIEIDLVAQVIRTYSKVTSLEIESNRVSDVGVQKLAIELKVNSTLTSLTLGSNNISDEGAKYIAQVLGINNTLTSVQMPKRSKIKILGANALFKSLTKSNTIKMFGGIPVSHFKINDANKKKIHLPPIEIGQVEVFVIAELIKTDYVAKILNLSNNQINDFGIKTISESLQTNSTLTAVILSNNHIGQLGIEAIAKALENNSTIEELDLSKNSIIDESISTISNMLTTTTTLTLVSLMGNTISKVGRKTISEAWKTSTNPKKLPINWNVPLKDFRGGEKTIEHRENLYNNDDAIIIAHFLDVNTVLTALDIRDNVNLGLEGSRRLMNSIVGKNVIEVFGDIPIKHLTTNNTNPSALPSTTKLSSDGKLILTKSGCGDTEVFVLERILRKNTTITYLNLSQNSISAESVSELVDGLKKNTSLRLICLNNLDSKIKIDNSMKEKISAKWNNEAYKKCPINWTLDLKKFEDKKIKYETANMKMENKITDTEATILAFVLSFSPDMTTLKLDNQKIADKGAKSLAEALKCHSLTKLQLAGNQIGNDGAMAFAQTLKCALTLVQFTPGTSLGLSFYGNTIDFVKPGSQSDNLGIQKGWSIIQVNGANQEADEKKILQAIIKTHSKGEHTQVLLQKGRFVEVTFKSIPFGFSFNNDGGKLKVDNIINGGQADKAGITKGSSIVSTGEHSTLENRIKNLKNGESIKLKFHVPNNEERSLLKELDLAKNQIGDEGAIALSESLKTNATLNSLKLTENQIGNKGAFALSKNIQENTTLSGIYLRKNKMDREGIKHLVEACKTNTVLTTVSLDIEDFMVEMSEQWQHDFNKNYRNKFYDNY